MVEAGMPEHEAILSSVKTASIVLGLQDQIGSIESGKFADIIAVEENPLEDITALQNVVFVMKDGKVVKE